MLDIRAFNKLKVIHDKVNEDEIQGHLSTHNSYYSCSWVLHIVHQHIKKQQRGDNTLKYVSGAKY